MWNLLLLNCPSSDMIEYQPQEMCLLEELRDIVTVFTSAANILTSENPLWGEMYVLRNIQLKYKKILRCDKCLVYLQRVSHCLKKMVLLNLSKSYLDLAERFLVGFSQDSSKAVQLPSRQQVEYNLVRTVSAAKLICDGIKYSRETFCYLLQKIKVGHMILDLVMAASVTAKLVILLKAILEQICNVYQQVLSWQFKLKKGSHEWSEKLDLPKDLKKWLETFASAVLKPVPMSQNDMSMLSSLLKSKDQNKDSDSDSIVIVDEVNNTEKDSSKQAQNGADADYGEVVPRKTKKTADSLTTEQKALLEKITQVQTLEDLEDMWTYLQSFPVNHLPKVLNSGKKKIVSSLFSKIRKGLSKKNIVKKFQKQKFLKNALPVLCKHLGFTHNQIEMCQKEPAVSNGLGSTDKKLEPVKTLKELKLLYTHLCNILQFSDELGKYRKLKKIFKRRRTDIKLLKQNGEKNTAKKLIFCTSKVFLTLCQK